jgi:hypothetical protein
MRQRGASNKDAYSVMEDPDWSEPSRRGREVRIEFLGGREVEVV